MRPKHDCGTELCTMRYMEYDTKKKKTLFKDPVTQNTECMWCTACKKPVTVEVMHS